MDDLISRQALLEDFKTVNPDFKGWAEWASYIIQAQPSAQQWIPCSERLPEAQTEVIVSCTDDSGDTKFSYTSSGWLTTDKEYWIVDNEINNFVVAWREMPEPYKDGDVNGKND